MIGPSTDAALRSKTMSHTSHRRRAVFATTVLAAAALAAPALAHHSFAMFDRAKTRVLAGTVQSFAHVNPHGYLVVDVKAQSGKVQTWTIESPSIYVMGKEGIVRDTFKTGDKITVTIYPLRNGTTGGQFVSATLPDGTFVGEKAS